MAMLSEVPVVDPVLLGVNPSALHEEGVRLHCILSQARHRIAEVLEVHDDEILFTSSATESDNIALGGILHSFLEQGIRPNEILIYSSELEHAAVTETVFMFTKWGVHHLSLATEDGIVNPKDIMVADGVKAVLISVMYVNNEIGTVQPIQEIAKRVRFLRKNNPEVQIVFHCDATQAPLYFPLRIPSLGVDMLTLGSTKLYGYKGVGVLYKRRGIKLVPTMRGGGQEFGLRPGTEPVALIHEFSYALQYAHKCRNEETDRVRSLQRYFESEIKNNFPQLKITAEQSPRTPHISHIAFPHFDSELMVIELDARGISVSAKSACKSEEDFESPIVQKLYGGNYGAVRFSFGRMTKKSDIDIVIKKLQSILEKYS